MDEKGRKAVPNGASRRWIRGNGEGDIPHDASMLLGLAKNKTKRFQTTAKSLGRSGIDQVEVERRLYALLDAGLIEIHERRDRRGDFEPYQWHLTEAGLAFLDSDLRVVKIHTMAVEPDGAGRAGYSSQRLAQYVLEVAAGALAEAGVREGDEAVLSPGIREGS